MSDEPSDAQKLIAEVIATHRSLFDGEACDACDWKFTNEYYGHDEHVAVEVDKALGGLTREWATEFDSWYRGPRGERRDYVEHLDYKGDEHSARDHVRTSLRVRLVTRFASGWTVTE